MGFKVRGYTREVPQEKVRDYSLFAIATEGTEREPDYFRLFDGIDRIKVDIIELETSDDEDACEKRKASSPSKVLEKVKAYITENQLSADDGDSLWCVIDVDRWPQEQMDLLFMERLQKMVSENMSDEDFSIDQLAEQMNMSRSSFYRKIKALTDMTPVDYLKMRRLEQASTLLLQGIRITEVAGRVGFTSSSYFAKCFKSRFGVLPKEFVSR